MGLWVAGLTPHNLLAILNVWTETPENEVCVNTIYLDFVKVFDTVPDEQVLHKLSGLDVQRVLVDGEESEWKNVVWGIPQGSVLDPRLFVCFVNDLPNVVTSNVLLFADNPGWQSENI